MLKSQHNPHQHTLDHPSSPLSPNFARRVRDDLPAHDGDLPTPPCPPTSPDMRPRWVGQGDDRDLRGWRRAVVELPPASGHSVSIMLPAAFHEGGRVRNLSSQWHA